MDWPPRNPGGRSSLPCGVSGSAKPHPLGDLRANRARKRSEGSDETHHARQVQLAALSSGRGGLFVPKAADT